MSTPESTAGTSWTGWHPGVPLLDGKAAIVVGGGRGIGEATARILSMAGAAIAVVDVEADRADNVAAAIAATGARSMPIHADVLQEPEAERIVATTANAFGSVDVLVNVAGGMNVYAAWEPLSQWSTESWDMIVGLNLRYHFFMTRAAFPRMQAAGGGSIVNITSISGVFGSPNHAAYGAAKAGLIHLTMTLALEGGAHGIRANAVSPGAVLTPATMNRMTPERRAEMAETTPLRRAGAPEDIARAVLFLASPMAAYVTGQMILVDGGVSSKFPLHAIGTDRAQSA